MTSKVTEARLPCPSCPSSDAFHRYDDGHGFCFSCEYFEPSTKGLVDLSDFTYEYVPLRGLTKETLKFYDIRTKIDKDGKPQAIQFKYPNGDYKVRDLAEKRFMWNVGNNSAKAGCFGCNLFAAGGHKYVTITEGELDAASIYQVLRSPAVSVHSAATAGRDCSVSRSFLNSYERIYLCFDNDGPGRDAARDVAKLFDYNKVFHVRLTNRKDANEFLQRNEADELRNIWWNSGKYIPDNIENRFEVFDQLLAEEPKWGVSYPFPTLNEMTYGIRTGESVLITAQEGVGKTEIMHAIEYKLLKETNDAIGAIFLEEPKRRHLQALAGLELKKPVHLPDSSCTAAAASAALKDVVKEDERLHVYSHFGSDDPESLLDTVRFLATSRKCRYILFDHINMAVSGLGGEDERKALDYLSTRLEMMVKELDFALILVAHVNDFGLTRGSRYISKVADIRIDAVRDLKSEDPVERNTTYLTVSKNRFSGKTGPAGKLVFDRNTYSYTEELPYVESPSVVSGVDELVA